jgi:hypothetical protein
MIKVWLERLMARKDKGPSSVVDSDDAVRTANKRLTASWFAAREGRKVRAMIHATRTLRERRHGMGGEHSELDAAGRN